MHFNTLFIGAAALSAASMAWSQSFMVNTPNSLVTCQPYRITWTGGQAPFNPRITQPGQVSQIIEQLPQTSDQFYLWNVNVAAGSTVTIVINDATGMQALSGISPAVVAGSDTSCVGQSASSAAGGSSTSAASSPSSSASGSSSSSASNSSATSAPSSSAASSTASRPASTTTSSAPAASSTRANSASNVKGASAFVAGVVGIAAAALF